MATRIIAVLNQKGGVGKTTSTVNLGAALALLGQRVLLVDMDPQANLTVHVGLEPHELTKTTYSLLLGRHGLAESVQETDTPGLRVVPSTLALANAEIQLASTVGRELVLREALDEYLDGPVPFFEAGGGMRAANDSDGGAQSETGADFVLIDCPPSLGTLTMNALCAANEVLLPIQTEFFALQGVAGILESVKAVQRLNRGLRLSMVVPCMVDRRTTLARDVIAEVREYFGDVVTTTEIRKNVKLAESPSHGKTIFSYDQKCNGAMDYLQLGREVLGLPIDDFTMPEIPRVAASSRSVETDVAPEVETEAAAESEPVAEVVAETVEEAVDVAPVAAAPSAAIASAAKSSVGDVVVPPLAVPPPAADRPAPGEAWIRMPGGANHAAKSAEPTGSAGPAAPTAPAGPERPYIDDEIIVNRLPPEDARTMLRSQGTERGGTERVGPERAGQDEPPRGDGPEQSDPAPIGENAPIGDGREPQRKDWDFDPPAF